MSSIFRNFTFNFSFEKVIHTGRDVIFEYLLFEIYLNYSKLFDFGKK